MASNNKLLGGRVKEEKAVYVEVDESIGWPKRLYREDCMKGKVVETLQEQEEHYKDGWVESPAFVGKEVKEEKKPVKGLKIDLSVKKKKE